MFLGFISKNATPLSTIVGGLGGALLLIWNERDGCKEVQTDVFSVKPELENKWDGMEERLESNINSAEQRPEPKIDAVKTTVLAELNWRICQVLLQLTYYDSELEKEMASMVKSEVKSEVNAVRGEVNVMKSEILLELHKIESRMETKSRWLW